MRRADDLFYPLPAALASRKGLSSTAKLVWAYLRFRQGKHDAARPSVGRMARDLGLHKETVRTAVHHLERAGLVEVVRSQGGGRVNCYRARDASRVCDDQPTRARAAAVRPREEPQINAAPNERRRAGDGSTRDAGIDGARRCPATHVARSESAAGAPPESAAGAPPESAGQTPRENRALKEVLENTPEREKENMQANHDGNGDDHGVSPSQVAAHPERQTADGDGDGDGKGAAGHRPQATGNGDGDGAREEHAHANGAGTPPGEREQPAPGNPADVMAALVALAFPHGATEKQRVTLANAAEDAMRGGVPAAFIANYLVHPLAEGPPWKRIDRARMRAAEMCASASHAMERYVPSLAHLVEAACRKPCPVRLAWWLETRVNRDRLRMALAWPRACPPEAPREPSTETKG
jgi:DNA-binding MarR family transcriptional regulator